MEFKDQVKSSIDIVKVVGEYVRLNRVGATGSYKGLCPFHQEKTPSLNVSQPRQVYYCHGCHAGGDALKFVMEIEGLTFYEALTQLADRNGIPIPKRTSLSDAETRLRTALYEMHEIAGHVFIDHLRSPQGAPVRAYLERRGVAPEMIDVFGLGYSDPGGQALTRRIQERGFTPEQIEVSGLARKRQEGAGFYDVFRGRLMFPIHNESGKIIAFGGRTMEADQPAKYVNSTETPIYRKSSVLYNLHRARDSMRKKSRAVLVEGYMDVIGAYAAGVTEVVASCGTALTEAQAKVLRRLAGSVVVNFDPDNAGTNATEKAIHLLLDEGLHVSVLTLDGGLDPDEYVKANGAETYRRKIDSAGGYFHWLADRARARFPKTAEGRTDAFKFLLPAVQKLHDKLERAAVANDLAAYLGVPQGVVLDQLRRAAVERRETPAAAAAGASSAVPANERILLCALIASDQAREEILEQLTPEMTEDFQTRAIFDAMRHLNGSIGPAAFSALESRLDAGAQALLHQVIAADEISNGVSALEQARMCLRKLQAGTRKRQVEEARVRVKTAEREGRMEEALRLIAELHQLEREIKEDRLG